MEHHEDRFTARDGCRLFERVWLPSGDSKGAVGFFHGFAEHVGRYEAFARTLAGHGYAVYAMDLRGHGRSAGPRTFVRSFDVYVADLEEYFQRVRLRQPERPIFLLGHSMGGEILALWAITRPPDVAGMILSAPPLVLGEEVFPVLRRVAVWVGRFFPRLRLVRVSAKRLARDPEVVARFEADPLVFHGRFPTGTGAEILRTMERLQAGAEKFRLPLLILHGTADALTDHEGSRQLYARAGSTDKTLKLYEGLYHDLFHEPEWEQVTADVVAWLDERAG